MSASWDFVRPCNDSGAQTDDRRSDGIKLPQCGVNGRSEIGLTPPDGNNSTHPGDVVTVGQNLQERIRQAQARGIKSRKVILYGVTGG